MVQSRLNNTINYKDTIQIDSEDIGHSSSQYEIELFDRSIIIIIGKPKYTFAKKNIVFYPVYVVDGDIIRGQIGIFEINSNNVLNILDDDDDIDLSKIGEPIYYNFISPPLISKLLTNIPICPRIISPSTT